MAADALSRVVISLTKRLPSRLTKIAPLPRTASVTITPPLTDSVG